MPQFIYSLTYERNLDCLQVFAVINKATSRYRILSRHKLSALLVNTEEHDYWIVWQHDKSMFSFTKNCQTILQTVPILHSHQQWQSSHCSTSSLEFGVVGKIINIFIITNEQADRICWNHMHCFVTHHQDFLTWVPWWYFYKHQITCLVIVFST